MQYEEVEFVCVNPEFEGATDPRSQLTLLHKLKQVEGVIVLYQDWSCYSAGQKSLTAIFSGNIARKSILDAALEVGVEVDIIRPVDMQYVNMAIQGAHECQEVY